MPSYHVERSIVIEKPVKEVRDSLKNFKEWPKWSPWIIMETDATLVYSDRQGQVGATYGWSGILVGAGSMELMEVHDDCLKMHIYFVKPFKSRAVVSFDFEDMSEETRVTWHMDGYLPFFLFWMTSKMKTFIGMDYERGLSMLKEYLETGSVSSYVLIEGVLPIPAQNYVGIPRICSIKELGDNMKKDFASLHDFMHKHDISTDRIPFSIYNTFDIFNRTSSYVACIPLDEEVAIDETWIRGSLVKTKALKTMHRGRYIHLGNGWMTAMRFAQMKKMKLTKNPVGYEFYLNDPIDTPEKELVTEIYLPLK